MLLVLVLFGVAYVKVPMSSTQQASVDLGTTPDEPVEPHTQALPLGRAPLQVAPRSSQESASIPRAIRTAAREPTSDEVREDEAIATRANSPQQREWRSDFVGEREDPEWTQHTRQALSRAAESLLQGALKIQELSCHETICRTYLQFADQLDAQTFIARSREPGLEYEFQSLDPSFDGEGFDASDYQYEVMIRRPRPAHLPAHAPLQPPAEAYASTGAVTASAATAPP